MGGPPARITALFALILVFSIMSQAVDADAIRLTELDTGSLSLRMTDDAAAIGVYRAGLSSILAYMDSTPQVFSPGIEGGAKVLPRAVKEDLWNTWKSYLDYHLALESIRQYYSEYYRLSNRDQMRGAFRLLNAAFLAQYRFSLQFLERTDRHPLADKLLNDPVPEIGLPARAFADFKFRYLNVLRAGEFAALQAIGKTMENPDDKLRAGMDEDSAVIWRMGRGKGEMLTLKNAVQVVRNKAFQAWYPVQAGVSQLMGDIKVQRPGRFLITHAQVSDLIPELLPGDIVLTRREWFLSNVGLPGFWSHAALYIGTAGERNRFFTGAEVAEWVLREDGAGGDLETLLQERYPEAYARFTEPDEAGHQRRVIEAVGEGVVVTTAEHALGADSIVVLRPRLPAVEKAMAVVRAFHYSGRPYDFNFDFTTDSTLVCSELVYKAYEPAPGSRGLNLPLVKVLGRPVTPPNDIARLFDDEADSDRPQMEFILFLDGFEKAGEAFRSTLEEFRSTWKRPNWHILVQK